MRRALALATLVLCACPVEPVRDNPKDPNSANPAPGSVKATVSLEPASAALADVKLTDVTASVDGLPGVNADSTGAVKVDNVKHGVHAVEVRAPYHDVLRFPAVTVNPSAVTDLGALVLLRGHGTINGTVLVSGREVPAGGCAPGDLTCGDHSGTQVSVSDLPADQPRFTLTNRDGKFSLANVPAGKHTLSLQRAGYDSAQLDVELLPDETKVVPPVTLGSGFSAKVAGAVLLENVSAPSAQYTSVTVAVRGVSASTQADVDGGFLLASPLGGTFTVEATAPGYDPAWVSDVVFVQNQTFTLPNSLVLRVSRGAIAGVVQLGGANVEGAEVCVEGQSQALCSLSDPSGAFLIGGVPTTTAAIEMLTATLTQGGNKYVGRSSSPVQVSAGQTVNAGTITLGYVGGDFLLDGHIVDPSTMAGSVSHQVTDSTWVGIELPASLTQGYVSFSVDAMGTWHDLPLVSPTDCTQAAQQTNPLCVQLGTTEGPQSVQLVLAQQTGGGGNHFGPLTGSIVYDVTPPSSVTVQINGGAQYINALGGMSMALTLTAVDAHTPVTWMQLAANSGAAATVSGAAVQGYNATPATIPIPDYATENVKYVAVRVFDAAGNHADASATVTLDKTPPSGVALTVLDANAAGDVTKSNVTLVLDPGTVTDLGLVRVSNDIGLAGQVASPFIPNSGATEHRAWLLNPGDGPRTVYAVFEDLAGNKAPELSAAVTVDSSAPRVPVVQLAENPCTGTPTDTKPNGFTKNSRVCLTVGYDSTDFDHFSVQGCAQASSQTATFDCDLSSGDGLKVVSVVAVDPAGNTSPPGTAQVVVDTVPPAAPSLTLFAGSDAAPTTVTSGVKYVKSTFVFYGLSAPADGAEVAFTEGGTTTQWAPVSSAGVYLLANATEGAHSVTAAVRDLAENASVASGASAVTLDLTAPATPSLTPQVASWYKSTTVNETIQIGADSSFWHFEVSGGGCSGLCPVPGSGVSVPYAFSLTANSPVPDVVRVHAKDFAGNVGADAVFLMQEDDARPPAPVLGSVPPVVNADVFPVGVSPQTDPASGQGNNFDHLEYAVVSSAGAFGACPSWPTGSWSIAGSSGQVVFTLPQNANDTLCVVEVDHAGNGSLTAASFQLAEDSQPPDTPQVTATSQVVNADGAWIWFANAVNDGGTLFDSLTGQPFDPGNHFDHFEVIGGRYPQFVCLPGTYDPNTRNWPVPSHCPVWTDRQFFEVPLDHDQVNTFFVRAVDRAGNVSSASLGVDLIEQSVTRLGAASANGLLIAPHIQDDRIVWVAQDSTSSKVELFDLSRSVPGTDAPLDLRLGAAAAIGSADVYKNIAVWDEAAAGDREIHGCDVVGFEAGAGCPGGSADVRAGNNAAQQPRIFGSRVVYAEPPALHTFTYGVGADSVLVATGVSTKIRLGRELVGWQDNSASNSHAFVLPTDGGAQVDLGVTLSAPALAVSPLGVADTWALWLQPTGGTTSTAAKAAEPFASTSSVSPPFIAGPPEAWRGGGFATASLADGSHASAAIRSVDVTDGGVSWSELIELGSGSVQNPSVSGPHVPFVWNPAPGSSFLGLLDRSWLLPVDPAGAAQSYPRVVGNLVVWLDTRLNAAADVFVLDRAAGTRRVLTSTSMIKDALAFDGRIVAWRETPSAGSAYRVHWLDITNAANQGTVGTGTFGSLTYAVPSVAGGKIVWSDSTAGNGDVLMFDTATAAQSTIVSGAADQTYPQISAKPGTTDFRLAWVEGGTDVYWQDGLAAGAVCLRGAAAGCQTVLSAARNQLSMSGDRLVWVEGPAGSGRLVGYLANKGAADVLSDPGGAHKAPYVGGNLVAYLESTPSGLNGVQVYDFLADSHYRLLSRASTQLQPATDGVSVVFIDGVSPSLEVMWFLKR